MVGRPRLVLFDLRLVINIMSNAKSVSQTNLIKKMKLAALFATVALAQDSGRSLGEKIDKAQLICSTYMEMALDCVSDKYIAKYTYRLDKLLMNAHHNVQLGRCDGNRRRRDTEAEQAYASNQEQVNIIESDCKKLINLALIDDKLTNCGKRGAWQKRGNQIFGNLVAKRAMCIEKAKNPNNKN